ncbi:MAG: 4-(cytidine 5'-diphospho)-2-C-methyl-D-erythritol kinase [Gammaproteobacteria bacterium]
MSSGRIVLHSPAKLNLFLHIVGRRPDGYHLLQTVFQLIDYGDTLSFSLRQDDAVHLTDNTPSIPSSDNLIIKAAMMLRALHRHLPGVDIHLDKCIPMGAGMGGGSSNAATTLLALNHLWGLGLSQSELMRLGLALGADVPVFVAGHSAFGEGIGEILTPIDLPTVWYAIVKPPVHAETASLFKSPALKRDTASLTLAQYQAGAATHNDFLPVLLSLYPSLQETVTLMSHFGEPKLTGTGSAFFIACESREKAEKCIGQMNKQVVGFVAQGVNESPVHKALQSVR